MDNDEKLITKNGHITTVAEHNAMIKKKTGEKTVANQKIFREYMRLTKDIPPEEAVKQLCERFDCKANRVYGVIKKRRDSVSPATAALNEAQIMVRVNALVEKAEDFDTKLNEEIAKIEASEDDWIEIEQLDGTGRDGNGTTTKKVRKFKYLAGLMRDKMDNTQEIIKGIKVFIPQTVINQTFDNRGVIDQYSDEEIDRRLDEANG